MQELLKFKTAGQKSDISNKKQLLGEIFLCYTLLSS
jgi:hypothetical protein